MRKLILGLLIVALLVGVAYYKNYREDGQRQTVYAEGLEAGQKLAVENTLAIDSIKAELAREQVVIDSLEARDDVDAAVRDSLAELIRKQEARIGELKRENDRLAEKVAQSGSRDQKILSYYNQRYNDLPGDLSDYEHNVALTEIRTETAKKFGISISELNNLRQKYNLSY